MSEEFTGKPSEMRDSQWLASEDLEDRGGKVTVTIAMCRKHTDVEFEAGRKVPTAYTLSFEGKEKEMILNATNRKKLVDLFGRSVADWKGKKIELYVQSDIRLMGKLVNGIRIRAAKK